jgi:hypothetical protein
MKADGPSRVGGRGPYWVSLSNSFSSNGLTSEVSSSVREPKAVAPSISALRLRESARNSANRSEKGARAPAMLPRPSWIAAMSSAKRSSVSKRFRSCSFRSMSRSLSRVRGEGVPGSYR